MHKILRKVKIYLNRNSVRINRRKISIPADFPLNKVLINGEYIHVESGFRVLGKGKISIGNNCILAERFTAITTLHQVKDDGELPYSSSNDVVKNVSIENNVWIGANVTIFGGVTVGEGAVIGANCLVIHDIPKCAIVGGVPARVIRYRDKDAYQRQVQNNQLYLVSKYQEIGHV